MSAKCPFQVGDVVTFRPTGFDLAHLSPLDFYGVAVGQTGEIVKIKDDRYVYLASSKSGLDWEMFRPLDSRPGELPEPKDA